MLVRVSQTQQKNQYYVDRVLKQGNCKSGCIIDQKSLGMHLHCKKPCFLKSDSSIIVGGCGQTTQTSF